MSIGAVCAFVGLAIFLNCLSVFWMARSMGARKEQMRRRSRVTYRNPGRHRASVRTLYYRAGYRSSIVRLYIAMTFLVLCTIMAGNALHVHPLITAIAAGVVAVGLPLWHLNRRTRKRELALLTQLPSALELMANGMRAGLGINSTFEIIAKEIGDPIGLEFSQMAAEMNLGGADVEQALNHLIDRNPLSDIRLFAQAVVINRQVGGNLAEVLDNLDRTIRERFWLERELKSATAEQRISAWVLGLMPPIVGLLVFALNPDYMLTLTRTDPGRMMLWVAAGLQVAGILIMRQIINVIDF